MKSVTLTYAIDTEATHVIRIKKNELVKDILKRIQAKQHNDNLKFMHYDGSLIDGDDTLQDFYDASEIFIVTETEDIPKEFDTIYTDEKKPEKVSEIEEIVVDDSDVLPTDIPKPEIVRPSKKDTNKKFRIYTTLTFESMTRGSLVDGINEDTDVEEIKRIVLEYIKNKPSFDDVIEDKDNLEVHFFLPSGVYFKSGSFGHWLDACDCSRYMLYAVVTRKLGDLANEIFKNVCDCHSRKMKLLLSPICDSRPEGYTQIASLLGFFFYGGNLDSAERILRCLATLTGFAPMVTSIYTIMIQNKVNGAMIASITAALQTFISQNVIESDLKSAFSYSISFISYLNSVKIVNLPVPNLYQYNYKNEDEKSFDSIQLYLKEHKNLDFTILWDKDFPLEGNKQFKVSKLPGPIHVRQLNESLTLETSLKPVSPMTIPYLHCVSFVRTEAEKKDSKTKVGLFVRKIPGRERIVEFIDPEKGGDISEIDYDDLAKEIGDDTIDDNIKSKGDTSLQQIIYVCLDISTSMQYKLDGSRRRNKRDISRMTLSVQLLKLLMKRIYDFKIPTARGLLTFGDEVEEKSPLSVSEKDFYEKVKDITAHGDSPIWEALSLAVDKINEFNPYVEDGTERRYKYPEAQGRIILISDAEPTKTVASAYAVTQKLLENKIILDVIMISTNEGFLDAIISSKFTGGYSFQPQSADEGIEIFETEEFLDVNSRSKITPIEGEINADTFLDVERKIAKNPYTILDDIKNKYTIRAELKAPLSSAEYTLFYRKDERRQPRTICDRYIIKQLKRIKKNPNENIIVYTFHNDLRKWRVFIKGVDGTPYENAWWHLFITFPSNYPSSPPLFRYISIPYHQNVSSAGKVLCLEISDGYNPKMKIADILVHIRNLFETPDDEFCLRQSVLDVRTKDNADFMIKARASKKANAKTDYKQFLTGMKINDTIPEDYVLSDDDDNHDLLVSQQGDLFNIKPKMAADDHDEKYD